MFPIIEKLGGWGEAEKILARRDLMPGDEGLKKWRNRGLPWKVKFVLALEARKRSVAFTEKDFMLRERAA